MDLLKNVYTFESDQPATCPVDTVYDFNSASDYPDVVKSQGTFDSLDFTI